MKEKTRKKLTSRKFWISVATAAYFGGMAIREQNVNNQVLAIVYGACMAAVVVAWVMIEGFCDEAEEEVIEESTEEEIEEEAA